MSHISFAELGKQAFHRFRRKDELGMVDRMNEIPGLIIMTVSSGAIIAPMIGFVSNNFGVIASLLEMERYLFYNLFVYFYVLKS